MEVAVDFVETGYVAVVAVVAVVAAVAVSMGVHCHLVGNYLLLLRCLFLHQILVRVDCKKPWKLIFLWRATLPPTTK